MGKSKIKALGRFSVWWGPGVWFTNAAWQLFRRVISTLETFPSQTNHLSKVLLLIPSSWGLGFNLGIVGVNKHLHRGQECVLNSRIALLLKCGPENIHVLHVWWFCFIFLNTTTTVDDVRISGIWDFMPSPNSKHKFPCNLCFLLCIQNVLHVVNPEVSLSSKVLSIWVLTMSGDCLAVLFPKNVGHCSLCFAF